MEQNNRTARVAATTTGAAALAVSAWAVIAAAHQDGAQAAVTCTVAAMTFVGSAVIGRIWQSRQYVIGICGIAFLIAVEACNLWNSATRIVVESEAAQASIRTAAGAHAYAEGELVAAQAAYDAATKAKLSQAAAPGCKDRCVALLNSAEIAAKADLEVARQRYAANPKPTASGSPLADRLGISAWVADLISAGLVAASLNGLAAVLIAYGTHAPARAPKTPIDPRPRKGRRGATTRDPKVVGFVEQYRARNGRDPSIPEMVSAFPGMATTTAQRYRRGNVGKVAALRVVARVA